VAFLVGVNWDRAGGHMPLVCPLLLRYEMKGRNEGGNWRPLSRHRVETTRQFPSKKNLLRGRLYFAVIIATRRTSAEFTPTIAPGKNIREPIQPRTSNPSAIAAAITAP
jgi:hypothetical protein